MKRDALGYALSTRERVSASELGTGECSCLRAGNGAVFCYCFLVVLSGYDLVVLSFFGRLV
jgi:hypothetical protein